MQKNYINDFQGLRWLLIFIIFIFHCGNERLNVSFIGSWGAFGVCAFIVMSGFLYQMKYDMQSTGGGSLSELTLLKECGKKFWKCAKKYYPLHWLMLLVDILLFGGDFSDKGILALIANALLLQSWLPGNIGMSFNTVSWYLSTTLFAVTFSPIFVRIVGKLKEKTLLWILGGILLIQFVLAVALESQWISYRFPPVRVMDFMAGAILYRLSVKHREWEREPIYSMLFLLGFILACGVAILSLFFHSDVFSAAAWSVAVWIIIYAVGAGDGKSKVLDKIFANRLAKSLGGITHEFFMIHLIVLIYVFSLGQEIGWHPCLSLFVSFAVTLAISYLLFGIKVLTVRLTAKKQRYA